MTVAALIAAGLLFEFALVVAAIVLLVLRSCGVKIA